MGMVYGIWAWVGRQPMPINWLLSLAKCWDAAGTEVGAAAAASRCLETLMRGAKVPTPHAKDSASSAHTARNMVNLNL